MSLPNYLSNIKSSGIYRFVWDKSELPGTQAETLRLVVGYSEKGPFNTPVYVSSESEFKTIYGGISKKLERYGVWFHRMALQALKRGPILALNIKPFNTNDSNPECVQGVSFNPQNQFGDLINIEVEKIYNTNRFWRLEPELLEELRNEDVSAGYDTTTNYITITATDSKETSNTIFMRGYQPKGYDITFKEWYSSVLNGEELPSYLEGHENDKLSQYWAEIYVFKGQFTPSIATSDKLAKFFDVNGETVTLKPYLTNAFGEKIDTLEQLAKNEASNFIKSYAGILLPEFLSSTNTVISLDEQFNADQNLHKMMMRLNQTALYNGDITIDKIDTTGWTSAFGSSNGMMSLTSIVPQVDMMSYNTGTQSWSTQSAETTASFCNYDINISSQGTHSILVPEYMKDTDVKEGDKFLVYVQGTGYEVITLVKDEELEVEDDIVEENSQNGIEPSSQGGEGIEVEEEEEEANTTIYRKYTFDTDLTDVDWTLNTSTYKFVKCLRSATATSRNMIPTYILGYIYGNSKPAGSTNNEKLEWQDKILNTLTKYKGIRIALTNRVNADVDYRYLVDTFEGFITRDCKSKLAMICKEKDNVLGLLNFPNMISFSKDERFRGRNGFDTKYIASGNYFTLASEEDGASWVSYNTSLNMKDVNTGIKYVCPAAALVSNLYMDKYTKYFPYTIVAGPDRAVITEPGLIGPDFNFSREDLDNLEPFGVNCMVQVPGQGTYINSNQTAKQNPVTALSKINVRELCIFLQDEIEKLLQKYQWDFNTYNLRNTIKDRADVICETCQANGGIYKYVNVCDESNNTDDVINNEMFVLSTSIEPGIGAGKMVHELTLYRKGGMSSVITD